MIDFQTNIDEFITALDKSAGALERFEQSITTNLTENLWPKVREKIKRYLIDNLEMIQAVQTSEAWRARKDVMKQRGTTVTRLKGGGKYPVISNENWLMTGVMQSVLTEKISGTAGKIDVSDDRVEFNIDIEMDELIDSDGVPYPIAVDKELLDRSGGSIGLVRLTESQISEVLEMLVAGTDNLAKELFGD